MPSKRTSACPAENNWVVIAAGGLLSAAAAPLLEHASACDYCGQLLREATDDLIPHLTVEERELVGRLPSARPERQRELALRMARVGGADRSGREKSAGTHRIPALSAWHSADWRAWAVSLAAIIVMASAIRFWMSRSDQSAVATNRLIAQAYTQQRPFAFRFPGAAYSPVRQTRGEQDSRLSEPQTLLDAEVQIARALLRDPKDPGWLQAKARADLLEGNYQPAIVALQQAKGSRPRDSSIQLDLAIAYFERAESTGQDASYELALQALNQVLKDNPNDAVALFNRALTYEKLRRGTEAVADWKRYQQLDPNSGWTGEAYNKIQELKAY